MSSQQPLTEQQAFTAFTAGEESGLVFFFARYYTPLIYYAQSITQDNAASEEIASEAFIKIWNRREQLESVLKLRNLLYNIVRNSAIDCLRKTKTGDLRNKTYRQTADSVDTNRLQSIIETETWHRLYSLLSSLPLKSREILTLYFFGKKSLHEIAKLLDMSPAAVKSQKFRALELLRKNASSVFNSLLIFLCSSLFF